MGREEAIRQETYYQCRRCGRRSPITAVVCTKPDCRAQLAIYGEVITDMTEREPRPMRMPETEFPENPAPVIPDVPKPGPSPREPEVTVRETETTVRKPDRPEVVTDREMIGQPFLPKRTLLIGLQILMLLAFMSCTCFCAYVISYEYPEEVVMAIAVALPLGALSIFLLWKEKYILSGILTLFNGGIIFIGQVALFSYYDSFVRTILAWVVLSIWMAVLAFIRAPLKQQAEPGNEQPFMKKATILVNLNIMVFVASSLAYPFSGFPWIGILACVAGIVLVVYKKYVIHCILYCLLGAFKILLAYNFLMDDAALVTVCANLTVAAIAVWLAVISYRKGE